MMKETHEEYVFASYILHLWRKRFLIALGTIICMALMAIYVQFVAKERFRSSAQIMIKEPREVTNAERTPLTALSYEFLLSNDDLIRQVMTDYAKAIKKPLTKFRLEQFKKAFEVTTEVEQDTTVRKEYSPIIVLTADADTPQNARLELEIWLRHFMQRYGDILSREADYTSRYYAKKGEELQKTLAEKEKVFLKLRWELPFKIRQLTAKELLLAPARVKLDYRDERRSYYKYRDQESIRISVGEPETLPETKGLEKQLVDTEIDLASAAAQNNTAKVALLLAKKKALTEKIDATKKEIASLQTETALLEKDFQALARDVSALRDQYQYVMDLKNQAEVDAEGFHYANKNNNGERTDIVILAHPSLPDLRIFPKKTTSCLIAGLVGLILSILAVVFDKFIRDSRALVGEAG